MTTGNERELKRLIESLHAHIQIMPTYGPDTGVLKERAYAVAVAAAEADNERDALLADVKRLRNALDAIMKHQMMCFSVSGDFPREASTTFRIAKEELEQTQRWDDQFREAQKK